VTNPLIIKTESGDELVVLPRRDYDAMLARLGDEAAEDRMTEILIAEAKAKSEVALPLEVWDEIEKAASPVGPLRKWRKMSQGELAKASGISQGFLSEIETGKKVGDVKTLRAIAKALGISLDDIVSPAP